MCGRHTLLKHRLWYIIRICTQYALRVRRIWKIHTPCSEIACTFGFCVWWASFFGRLQFSDLQLRCVRIIYSICTRTQRGPQHKRRFHDGLLSDACRAPKKKTNVHSVHALGVYYASMSPINMCDMKYWKEYEKCAADDSSRSVSTCAARVCFIAKCRFMHHFRWRAGSKVCAAPGTSMHTLQTEYGVQNMKTNRLHPLIVCTVYTVKKEKGQRRTFEHLCFVHLLHLLDHNHKQLVQTISGCTETGFKFMTNLDALEESFSLLLWTCVDALRISSLR